MSLINNTIRINGEFIDFDGNYGTPSSLTLEIWEQNDHNSFGIFSGSSIYSNSTGIYYMPFTVPDGIGNLLYQWTAVLNGYPMVNRGVISREWLRI
jgi:hypothetical protein